MKHWPRSTSAGALALIASATSANAHIIGARLGDFYAGAAHPLTDLADLILWFALALLAGSLGPSAARPILLFFPLGLLAGSSVGAEVVFAPAGGLAASGMLVLLGLLLAAGLRIHRNLLCVIAFGAAAMRGASNAGGMGPETNRLLFALGIAIAGYVAIALVAAATVAFRGEETVSRGWRRIAIRALGSWIAAIGLMMGGLALAS
ncbi:HupE/UreJ family protein [Methylosinus sp. Ce-a6]|uniref:HupE/UreJ family protein n=1 Tax=Methylosinus sp. Ce-a6 TaxID=2172005 RepID=UPI00135AB5B5|nr:HupE/UreJ family protein [Methylosinus sp. Ce-a6]